MSVELEVVRDHSHQVAEARLHHSVDLAGSIAVGSNGAFFSTVWVLRLRRTYAELGDIRISGLEDVVFVAQNPLYPPSNEEWRDFVFDALLKMEANLDAMEDRRRQENMLNVLTNHV